MPCLRVVHYYPYAMLMLPSNPAVSRYIHIYMHQYIGAKHFIEHFFNKFAQKALAKCKRARICELSRYGPATKGAPPLNN